MIPRQQPQQQQRRRRPFNDWMMVRVTIVFWLSVRLLYQDSTILTRFRPPRQHRIVTTKSLSNPSPPPSQNDDSIDHPTNTTATSDGMDHHHAWHQTTTTRTTTYVPLGHTTIFVPHHSKHINSSYYYSSSQEMQSRHERFPSVPERVQLYMSTWYQSPCRDNVEDHVRYSYQNNDNETSISSTTTTINHTTVLVRPIGITVSAAENGNDSATTNPPLLSIDSKYSRGPLCFLYNRSVIQQCADHLCQDANQYFVPYVDHYYPVMNSDNNDAGNIPLILQHGDANFFRAKEVVSPLRQNSFNVAETVQPPLYLGNPNIPIFKKFRRSMTPLERAAIVPKSKNSNSDECFGVGERRTLETALPNEENSVYHDGFHPIVSIVSNFGRHFYSLMHVIENDTQPWEQKTSKAIYRGLCTGRSKSSYRGKKIRDTDGISEYDLCQQIPRCRLVYEYRNSTLVDAKLTAAKQIDKAYTIRGTPMIGRTLSMKELLQNKGIIMIEGNDVSSGLKWALFSKSVVLTQTPTYTSWAMEELLVPWVHYIPIADDLSDVNEKVQWMIDHDETAKEIAINGHLWMTDMIFHPDAMRDHEAIIQDTFQRYQRHFWYDPSLGS